jgi:hypothetical protein
MTSANATGTTGAGAPLYGLMAEFDDPHQLVVAATRARERGYRRLDAYSPFPVHGLAEALGQDHTRLPLLVLLGGLAGACAGYGLAYFVSVIDYPLNVGGRPFHSWPSFIPVTFETTVLFAALSAVLGMIALNGLPRPHHPVFNVDRFALASRNRFFLVVEADDPRFDRAQTRAFLAGLEPSGVFEVEG